MNIEARERESATRQRSSFEKWLDKPMVRMGMSMIPAGEKQDVLRMLLPSAHEDGFHAGGADIVGQMMEGIMKRKPGQPG